MACLSSLDFWVSSHFLLPFLICGLRLMCPMRFLRPPMLVQAAPALRAVSEVQVALREAASFLVAHRGISLPEAELLLLPAVPSLTALREVY